MGRIIKIIIIGALLCAALIHIRNIILALLGIYLEPLSTTTLAIEALVAYLVLLWLQHIIKEEDKSNES